MSDSVGPYGQQPTRLLCSRDSLGKNTGVGCHFLLHLSQFRGGKMDSVFGNVERILVNSIKKVFFQEVEKGACLCQTLCIYTVKYLIQ